MADEKDPKKPPIDLLEGFDDAFDEGIENFADASANREEKTEFLEKDDLDEPQSVKPPAEKTEVVFKSDEEDEDDELKTQIEMKDPDAAENVPGFEPTRNSQLLPKIHTEDLASLIDEPHAKEGRTEDSMTYDASKAQSSGRITEDLSSLINEDGANQEGGNFTETFSTEIHSDDLLGRSGAIPPPQKSQVREDDSSDFSSLIEEEISGKQGKTEDLSSLIHSDAVEGVTDDEIPPTKPLAVAPPKATEVPPPIASTKKDTGKAAESAAASAGVEKSISPMKAEEDSKTIRVRTTKQKMIIASVSLGVVIVIGAGITMFFKNKKNNQQLENMGASTSEPEKVVDSQELLKELEEKYNQTAPLFNMDTFKSYSEASNRLEEILNTYPNHPKANSRLAEAILLKFEGYLDGDRKNRVFQLIEKAESVDPNSVETLRVKARNLTVDGKNKDAEVRIQQALNQKADDVQSLQTYGEIQLATGNTKSALAQFSKAMELQPDYVRAKYFYYVAKEKLGDLGPTKEALDKLVTETNGHAKSSIERYAIQVKLGDTEGAKKGLQEFLTTKESELGPSDAARGWKLVSEIELKKSNMKEAIEALEKSVFKMPLDADASFELGNLYYKQRNYEKATQHYSTAVTLKPDETQYLLQLGISLREQGRLKEAEESLKKLITKDPKNFEGLYQHALTKYKMGFVDEVVPQLEQNIKDNPTFLLGKILLGNILLEQNDLKNSFKNFQEALSQSKDKKISKMALSSMGEYYLKQEQWGKAKDYYDQANAKDSEDFEIHNALAKINLQMGNIIEAQSHLRKMDRINPDNIDSKVLEGNILVRQKEYDKAINFFKEVINKRDNDYETRVELAKVYLEKKQFADALQELLVAYRFNAEYFYTYYYMGIAHRGLNDLTESERNLNKAITILPKFYKAHYELGLTFLKKEDVKKGEEELMKALELQPNFIPALEVLGDYYFDRNVFNLSNKYYTIALEKQPKNVNLIIKQAKTYHEMGNDKKSIALLQKTLQLRPNSAETYFELGILYEENNDLNQALRHYQRSVALDAKDPKPYYQLGFLYKAIGQNSKAAQSFRSFLKLNPDAIDRADIEDQIKKLTGNK